MATKVEIGRKEEAMRLVPDAEGRYARQDYGPRRLIEGVQLLPLRRFHDDAGSMTELARFVPAGVEGVPGFAPAQINYATLVPGAIKAFHVHRRQTDLWFVPPEDRVLLVMVDVREGSPTAGVRMRVMLGDMNPLLALVPPGVAHGCRNLGTSTARIVYLTDVHFRPEPELTDEGRLPWDFAGPEIWEPVKE
ncbi:MAG TPA: dTDP-4-dehydrorhamnose 3,5-epimerase family protein [Candidatus Polarisedimenticolaceae bacterium]|nr:dTDP-4-dehydrorhamnose 3,5-epimerase family protein [Candidatus Polarisedimenticolaceae bacterium]